MANKIPTVAVITRTYPGQWVFASKSPITGNVLTFDFEGNDLSDVKLWNCDGYSIVLAVAPNGASFRGASLAALLSAVGAA